MLGEKERAIANFSLGQDLFNFHLTWEKNQSSCYVDLSFNFSPRTSLICHRFGYARRVVRVRTGTKKIYSGKGGGGGKNA